jgi:hypothetical protein
MAATTRLTVVTVAGVEYAVSGRVVRTLPAREPLPQRFVHEGLVFPLADLPARAGGEPGDPDRLVLLVEDGSSPEGVRRAVVAVELVAVEGWDLAALQPVPAVYPPAERRGWRGLLPRADGRLVVLVDLATFPETFPPAASAAGMEG